MLSVAMVYLAPTWLPPRSLAAELLSALGTALGIALVAKSPRKYVRYLPFAILGGLVFLGAALRSSLRSNNPKNDFLPFYVVAKYVGAKDFYAESSRAASEESLQQGQIPMPFVRLPFYALLLYPLARMKYATAYILWQIGSVLSLLAGSLLWRPYRASVALGCAWSLPIAMVLIRGQDVSLMFLLLSLAVALAYDEKPGLSGGMLAMCAIKWNIVLTLPLLVVKHQSPRFRAGFGLVVLVLIALSFLVAGIDWPGKYIQLILLPEVSPHASQMPNLRGLIQHAPFFPYVAAVMASAVLLLDWMVVKSTCTLEYKMAATLVSSILLSPHAYVYDCAVLIPFLVAVAYQTSRTGLRYISILLLTPALYALLSLPGCYFIPSAALLLFLIVLAIDATRKEGSPALDPWNAATAARDLRRAEVSG
jgi:hypothetical protein